MGTPETEAEHLMLTLRDFGVEVDEVDAAVIRATLEAFRPQRDAFIDADLSGVPRELGFDPSRAPKDGV